MKLTEVNYDVPIAASAETTWSVLARYGDVGDFIGVVAASRPLNGSSNTAQMGAERHCDLPGGRRMIEVSERIIAFNEGESYTYDVFDWKNFPLAKMEIKFGVRGAGPNKSILYQRNRFRLRPALLGIVAKGKLRNGMRDALLAYKNMIETGEGNVDAKTLSKKYRDL